MARLFRHMGCRAAALCRASSVFQNPRVSRREVLFFNLAADGWDREQFRAIGIGDGIITEAERELTVLAFTRAVNLNYGLHLSFDEVAALLEADEYRVDAIRAHLQVLSNK